MQAEGVRVHLPGGWNVPPLGIHQYLALMIVAVALWALGSVWMGLQATGDWVGTWQKNIVLHVYLPQTSNDKFELLQQNLKHIEGVKDVTPVPHNEAAKWMQHWLGKGVGDAAIMAKHLPETLVVSLQHNETEGFIVDDVRETASRLGAGINEDEVRLLGMRDTLDKAEYLAWFVTILLGAAMSLIVSNTLRMILLARADEIHLMRLMGAKEWFVRISLNIWILLLPLVVGGAALGCLGAAIATARLTSPDSTA